MADDVQVTQGAGTKIAADDVAGVYYQKNKIDLGGDGATSPLVRGQLTKSNSIPVTVASDDDSTAHLATIETSTTALNVRGQTTKVNALPVTLASNEDIATTLTSLNVRGQTTKTGALPVTLASNEDIATSLTAIKTAVELIDDSITGTRQRVQITDGTSDATVRNLTANDALNVAIVDGSGNHVTSFGGSGGTSSTDDADFTPLSTSGTPVMGVREDTPTTVTDGDMGVVGIDSNRRVKVVLDASTLDVAHDAADANAPVKVGHRARTSLYTAVANNDRADSVSDVFGRQLVSHMDPSMQVWKSFNATTTQTGAIIWDPAAGKKIAITHLQVNSYGTTAARIIIFFNTTTTYTEGTHQPVFKGKHSPSSTSTPGALPPITYPLFSATTDAELRITTDAGISIDVVAYGYEF